MWDRGSTGNVACDQYPPPLTLANKRVYAPTPNSYHLLFLTRYHTYKEDIQLMVCCTEHAHGNYAQLAMLDACLSARTTDANTTRNAWTSTCTHTHYKMYRLNWV